MRFTPPAGRLRRLARSNLVFCLGLAVAMLATRIVAFDAGVVFNFQFLPNHDMAGALPFFATNVHACRTTGDIAWWNPVAYSGHGYPQYFQSFLSPLAPTSGHIVLIVWMQCVRALSAVGVVVPEYVQYLVMTFGVLPFLTFFSFAVFASLIFRRRATVVLVATAYTLSGIGLWNSAWFYFQESFTLFFLLAAWVGLLKRPTLPRAMALIAAVLVQVASINYWTVYNSWFVLIVVAGHGWAYRTQVVRAWLRLRRWTADHRAAAAGLAGLIIAVTVPWVAIVAMTAHEQASAQVRPGRDYGIDWAYSRVQSTRWFTVELFNPFINRTMESYLVINAMHSARYIGMVFLPLLVLVPFATWRRRERWLAVSAAGVLCVCIAPPMLLAAWKATPGLDRVFHFFYFYTHFWQILLVLLAGTAFDRLICGSAAVARRRIVYALGGLTGSAVLALLVVGWMSDRFPAGDSTIEAVTRGGLILVVTCGFLAQLRLARRPAVRQAYAWVIVAIAGADLSRYFYEVSRLDHAYTRTDIRANMPFPLPPEVVDQLCTAWPPADPAAGFAGGLAQHLPIDMEFWPDNRFLVPQYLWPVWRATDGKTTDPSGIIAAAPAAVVFYAAAKSVPVNATESSDVNGDPERFYSTLVLHGGPIATGLGVDAEPVAVPHEMTRGGYNDFRLTVEAPGQGWLLLHQSYDPLWNITIDGQSAPVIRANQFRMAVAVAPGKHSLEMSYRPFARGLYWPACSLLEAGLLTLGTAAWRARGRTTANSRLRLSEAKIAKPQAA